MFRKAKSSDQALLYRRTANFTYEVYVKREGTQLANFDRFALQEADMTMRRVCEVPSLAYISAPIPQGDEARLFLVKCSIGRGQIKRTSQRDILREIIVD